MRVTQQDMESGHRRIVEGASRLMRERGIRETSVADAMQEAGMTHGGFYRHFETKDALVAEALRSAFDEFAIPLELRQQAEPAETVAAEYKSLYLSEPHVQNPGQGCPMPALGSELSRQPEQVRQAFAAGLGRVITALAECQAGPPALRRAAAAREVAMLVGAVLLARASDPAMAAEVLAACRE